VVKDGDGHIEEYEKESDKPYGAKAQAVNDFLVKYQMPGRPYIYLMGDKKNLLEVSCRGKEDRRHLPRVEYGVSK